MWTSVELRLRRAAAFVTAALGTPAMAAACLALVGCSLAVEAGLALTGRHEAAEALSRSAAVGVIAALAIIDAGVGLRRVLAPLWPLRPRVGAAEYGALALRAAQLLVAVAFGLSLLARDAVRVRIAVGEHATGDPAQLVGRDAWRPFTVPLGKVGFTVTAVGGRVGPDGASSGVSAELRLDGGGTARASAFRPALLDRSRAAWPVAAGYALRYQLAVERGGVLDTAVAKLALSGGRDDTIRSAVVPHRVYVRLVPTPEAPRGGTEPRFDVAVYRGKLVVARGRLGAGGALPFEGLVLRVPEVSRWVELRLVRDPGFPVALLGVALAAAGVAALGVGRGWRRRGKG